MSDWRDTPIEALAISVRAYNCLMHGSDIRTAGQLAATSDYKLLQIDNLGRKTLRELRAVLAGPLSPSDDDELHAWVSRNRILINWVMEHEALVALLMHGKATAQLQVKLSATHAGTGREVIIPAIWP